MAWDFETEPEFERELQWMDEFVREEVESPDQRLGRKRPDDHGRQHDRRPSQKANTVPRVVIASAGIR